MSVRVLPLLLVLATACATTGATVGSGVGDTFLEHPPYVAGARTIAAAGEAVRIGALPVIYQRGASQPAMFDPAAAPGTPAGALIEAMDAYLDSLTTASGAAPVRLVPNDGPRVTAVAPTSVGVPPDVRFGCRTDTGLPDGDCVVDDGGALGRGRQQLKLAVGRPSPEWVTWARGAMEGAGVTHALVLTLEVGQLLPRQRGLVGKKVVELGEAHEMELPWLSSLETPVMVVQLTGALVDRNGRAVRIAVEGITAKRTGFLASALGAQEVLSPEDLASVRTLKRSDLAGQPLAWQEAMRQVVRQLTR